MIELYKEHIKSQNRQSSKGNQMKWLKDNIWYKADYTGYEGLSEYVVAKLLAKSNIDRNEYVDYEVEIIKYGLVKYNGCKSTNFLQEGWQMITLERLFMNAFGESLFKSIYKIADIEERVKFLVNQTERLTGLKNFGIYLCKLLTIDAFFLNEDRHTHNIAVLINEKGDYKYCPIFDNGGCLLSDTHVDYPLSVETGELMNLVEAKTFSRSFDDQLDAVEKLYGMHVVFDFDTKELVKILDSEPFYSAEIKDRIYYVVSQQRRKYQYLFPSKKT
jgi:hypothetical protein